MALPGVTPFPPEFAARYRARGYWEDRPLRDDFVDVFARFADRIALIDGDRSLTYARPRRRVEAPGARTCSISGSRRSTASSSSCPTSRSSRSCYFALQKIGAIPIMALLSHRFPRSASSPSSRERWRWRRPRRRSDFDFAAICTPDPAEQPGAAAQHPAGEPAPGSASFSARRP